MKMNKALFAVFAVTLLGVGLVSAYGWMSSDDHYAIQSAIDSGDYNAWKEAHIATLTEDNFKLAEERYETMSQMRDLMDQLREARQDGDDDKVSELQSQIEALRPEDFNGMKGATDQRGQGFGQGMHSGERAGFDGSCPFMD